MELKTYKPKIHPKGWGREEWIVNDEKMCGKLLVFEQSSRCSMHFHLQKDEVFYVLDGEFDLNYIDTETAKKGYTRFHPGDCIHIPPGQPHQLFCWKQGQILEISTHHDELDSYRIEPGDSQKAPAQPEK